MKYFISSFCAALLPFTGFLAADYQPKDFSHLIGHVPGIDDDLLKMHFKLYEGYVNNSNLLLKKIGELDEKKENRTPEFAGMKRMLGWELDGMFLHELYFENLGKTDLPPPDSPISAKIAKDFGSFDAWKNDFIATGSIRGIGWVVAYIDPKDGRLINQWINEHDVGHLAGGKPVLIMDVFEHAYITQYGLDRAKYITAFFDNINWKVVEERYASLQPASVKN